MSRKVVRLKKNGKYKIVSPELWREFLDGLAKDVEGGTLVRYSGDDAQPQRSPDACRECCGRRRNVEFCGMYIAICTDGSSCVLG